MLYYFQVIYLSKDETLFRIFLSQTYLPLWVSIGCDVMCSLALRHTFQSNDVIFAYKIMTSQREVTLYMGRQGMLCRDCGAKQYFSLSLGGRPPHSL